MEDTTIAISRLRNKKKWAYSFHSELSLQTEEYLKNTRFQTLKLGKLVAEISDGLHSTRHYVDDGIIVLAVRNISEFGLDLSNKKMITQAEHEHFKRSQVQPEDLLVTITGRLGTALVYTSEKPANLSAHVARVKVHANKVNPYYLAAYLNSNFGKQLLNEYSIGSIYAHINVNGLQNVQIVLPSRPIQDRIAQIMQNAYAKRQNKLSEAERLYQTIDSYVFSRLGITLEDVEEKRRFLRPIAEIYKSRFDVDFNMGFHKFDPYINQVLPVKAVAKFPKRIRKLSNEAEAIFQYIDISSIDIQLGEIERAIEITEASAPSRARQVVHTGDIIVSTVRPTRGAIALIQNETEGFICSTGFTIIHPTKKVSSAYLHLALRLSTTLEQFKRRSAGSSYPAILENDIQETLIPVPDKEVQNEIATEVTQRCNKAKSLRIKAEN
ncbi:MAG: restriction endonuclease subunit S [Hassallia sp.]